MRNALSLALMLFATAALAEPYAIGGPARASLSTDLGAESDIAYTLGAGYSFGRFAVEAAYSDFGKIERESTAGTLITTRSVKATGFGLALVGTMPLRSVELVARLGAQQVRSTSRVSVVDVGPPLTSSATKDTAEAWRPALAAGLQFDVDDWIKARVLLEHIDGAGSLQRARLLSLTALLSF